MEKEKVYLHPDTGSLIRESQNPDGSLTLMGKSKGLLSEAIRLATQNPYEAGYRDGFAHGRLLADQGRTIEDLLAALKAAAAQLDAVLNGDGRLDTDGIDAALLIARAAIERAEKGEA